MFPIPSHHPHQYAFQPGMQPQPQPQPQPQAQPQAQPQPQPQAPAPAPARQYSAGQGTSSAFSSSANPDEDWTKISDLAERRRIQNRIAQRNYRKKLKRRLEDLERRAGSSDGDEPEGAEGEDAPSEQPPQQSSQGRPAGRRLSASKVKKSRAATEQQQRRQPQQPQAQPQQPQNPVTGFSRPAAHMQYTPPLENSDDVLFGPSAFDRDQSDTPPMYTYTATYPPPDDSLLAPYGPSSFSHVPQSMDVGGYQPYGIAPQAMGSPMPAMTPFNDEGRKDSFPSEGSMSNYSYSMFPGMDMGMPTPPNPYDQSNPHTPPLSHSFDHSANCSESGYEYPQTPLSMPESPGHLQFQHV